MADSQTNINLNIDTSQALANLKALQSQISAFQTQMARGSATQAANAAKLRQNLLNDINATRKFSASIENIKTTTESFTTALEKNKLSMGEYFRYAGGATKNFGRLFGREMATIDKVARERVKTLQTQYIQMGRDASGAMKAIAVRPLVLDMEDLGTKTAIAAQKQQILNQLLKQGSTNLLNWGKNTQWAGRQLMVGFTIPLTMAGTAAAKSYMEMEKAAIKLRRVYGDFGTTAEETDKMVKSLQSLAQEYTKYGVAVADTMDMASQAAAAGKMGAELTAQVANATRLSVLGTVEQGQALETTMSLTNAFGLAAEDLAGKINFLNAVENQTVTSIEDLTIAIPKAAPVIKQLGGNVEDLAFFLTAMKEGGINASEGANALKSGIASMINPTAKASEFLQGFGINLKGIVEANKGNIKGTIVEFAKALDTLDPLNRAQAIEQLFGKFQFARLSTLFQNVTKEGTQAQRVLELSNATTEELAILSERELKRVESSPMFKFQKAVEDIKVKLVPIGEAFLKAVTPIIDFVGKFLDGFNKMSDGAKNFWITFTGLVAGLGPLLLMTVGLIGNGVANLIKMFVGIKSFINRTTQETGNLGESTSYMTEAQIKAAAVASSLDQVHQQLIQRFTSEAGALDQLTQAYGRNIAAQNAYGPMGTMPTNVGKKYASGGIISGPGTGTSDSIIARVSNGEAIIPAKSVAQNPDLVKGLISGNIPGFFDGGLVNIEELQSLAATKFTSGTAKIEFEKELSDILRITDETIKQQVLRRLKEYVESTKTVAERSMKDYMRDTNMPGGNLRPQYNFAAGRQAAPGADQAHVQDSILTSAQSILDSATNLEKENKRLLELYTKYMPDFKVVAGSGFTFAQDQSINRDMRYGGAVSTQRFLTDFETRGAEKWKQTFVNSGLDWETVQQQVDLFDQEITQGIKSFDGLQITTDDFAKIVTQARQKLGSKIAGISTTIDSLESGIYDLRINPSAQLDAAGFPVTPDGKYSIAPDGTLLPRRNRRQSNIRNDRTRNPIAQFDAQAYLDEEGKVLKKPENDPYPQTRHRNSPHPLAQKDGMDDANAYLGGQEKAASTGTRRGLWSRVSERFNRLRTGQTRITGGQMSGALMTTSMVIGSLSMVGGKLGELAQNIMPVIGGLTMLQMVLQNVSNNYTKAGITAAAAIGYAIFQYIQFGEKVKSAQEEVLGFGEAVGTSAKALQGMAEFAGKATASEIMDKRRGSTLSPYQVVTGKTTFGENFVKSEAGKSIISAMGSLTSTSSIGQATGSLSSQLATEVLAGGLTTAQARSIAINIGKQMGNMGLGIKIAGELTTLLGPNGENILEKGLDIRLNLIQKSQDQTKSAINTLNTQGGMTGTEFGSALGSGAIGLGVGTAAGLTAAGGLAAVGAAMGWNPAGWILLAVAGVTAVAGAVAGFVQGSDAFAKRLGKLTGAVVSIQSQALDQQKQLLDSLDLDYEKRINAAKAAGDAAKAERLQNQYIVERQKLLDRYGQTVTQIRNSFATSPYKKELLSGVDKAITKKYKGTANEDLAAIANEQLSSIPDEGKRFELKLLLSSTVDPASMLMLSELATTNKDVIDKALNINFNLQGTGLAQSLEVASLFVNDRGEANKTLQTDFIAKMSTLKGKDADDMLLLFGELGKTKDNFIDATVIIDTVLKNPQLQKDIIQDIKDIKGLPNGKLSVDIVQKANIINPAAMAVLKQDVEYFNNISTAEEQKVYLQYAVMLSGTLTITDPNFLAWLQTADGSKYKADVPGLDAYRAWLAGRVTTTRMAMGDTAFVNNKQTTSGNGPSASWLDDYVKGIRDLVSGSQKLTVGFAASSKALSDFAKKTDSFKNSFSGLANNLYASGISQDIIDAILGMPKEEAEKEMKRFFDKNGKITQFLKQFNEDAKKLTIARYIESGLKSNQAIVDRVNATKALAEAGTSAALSSQMMADADTVAALAAAKSITNLKEQKKQVDNVTQAFLKKAAQTRLANSTEQNAIEDAQARISVLEAENNIYQTGLDIISKKSEKIAEIYDRQIEALQKVRDINDEIEKQKQGQLDLADALSRGDIGAAAKAMEQLRAQRARDAVEKQTKALEDAKKRALDAVTVELNGQVFTRAELEQKIYDISLEVLNIKKDEVDQNQLILEKQDLQFRNLIAQYAQVLKNNAELGKAITKTITIKTVSSGGGTGGTGDTGGTGGSDQQKIVTPTKPTTDAGYGKTWTFDASSNTWKATNVAQPTVGMGENKTTIPVVWDTKTDSWVQDNRGQGPIANSPEGDLFAKGAGIDPDQPITPSPVTAKNASKWAIIPFGRYFKMPAGNYYLGRKILKDGSGVAINYGTEVNATDKKMVGSLQRMEYGFDKKLVTDYWQRFHKGGLIAGNAEVPIMAKGGEFVMNDLSVKKYGIDTMKSINSGTATNLGDSVYNYSVSVNVSNAGASANDIARTVMAQIKQIDSQRIRSSYL